MIFQFAKLKSQRVACANRAAPATKDPVGIENIEGPRPAVMLGSPNTPDPKDVMWGHTLWLLNIAMENGPCIDGLPFLKMVMFHGELLNNQMVNIMNQHDDS